MPALQAGGRRFDPVTAHLQTSLIGNILLLAGGLALLASGGHWLVQGASGIARRIGVSPLIVGLTIVAFGTSTPELAISLIAALRGQTAISIGNIIGSNVANVALILAIAALVRPLESNVGLIRRDIPLMFASYAILLISGLAFGRDAGWIGGRIGRLEGIGMIVLIILYLFYLYRGSAKSAGIKPAIGPPTIDMPTIEVPAASKSSADPPTTIILVLLVGVGITGLTIGSRLTVDSASWLARELLNAGDRFIGIAIVALGTSLPELFTSIVASMRREVEISLGNIVGSNIFNALIVPGATALIAPITIVADFRIDFAAMVAISLLLWLLCCGADGDDYRAGAGYCCCAAMPPTSYL